MTEPLDYDPRYLVGICHFNACDFYEAHEVWEELWADDQGPSRPFYQGLIQAAVCLHHFGNGNLGGARKLFHSSRAYLEPYRPSHEGIDLQQFLEQMQQCCAQLLASGQPQPDVEIDPQRIPEIHLDPPPAHWPEVPEVDE